MLRAPAKGVYVNAYRGFESLPLRQQPNIYYRFGLGAVMHLLSLFSFSDGTRREPTGNTRSEQCRSCAGGFTRRSANQLRSASGWQILT
jgi:hypothetical protein